MPHLANQLQYQGTGFSGAGNIHSHTCHLERCRGTLSFAKGTEVSRKIPRQQVLPMPRQGIPAKQACPGAVLFSSRQGAPRSLAQYVPEARLRAAG